ncbi:MAG: HlyC/CorC family transporter [Hamadaea sp.]|uniref:hemolysin family protein n=1 Tax=Hamadaea sp. TaxID=2024425 RepID=UPI0017B82FA4|nr:hemolysin family protein [Hamadaea sp.]NUR71051.1 HlyC/CorC family transporter [Hamadaea sp.]NUT24004.1 HlyC/CorC family transporter [Hamadaea sp.]
MGGYGTQVVLVLILVLVNGALSGSEMALISLRESQIQRLERSSRGGRVLARLSRDPNRFLATIQIGITLAGFLASAAAAVSLAKPLVEPLSFLGTAAEPASIVIVTIVLTFVTLVLGELAPKRIAMQRAESWALIAARPLDWMAVASRPVVWLLGKSTDLIVALTGGDPRAAREEISAEEIRELVVAQRGFTPQQREIISGAFEITERMVREILVPRRDVTTLPVGMSVDEALARLAESGHTRAPVVGPEGLDDVFGVVHLRDLLGGDRTQTAVERVRPAVLMPETLSVSDAMRQLRQQREQFALIVDERGAIDGIITMEDLVEEVVGEIYDETDRDIQEVVTEADGVLLVPGAFPIHDLPDLGIDVERLGDIDYTTVAGLVLDRLGRIPDKPGDVVKAPGFTAEVVEVTGRAITKVRLRLAPRRSAND